MKKLTMLILLVLVASLLVAAIPTKMMRLTIINKSGYDVYMKLEGSPVTDAYYYLTVAAGDRDAPTIKIFTVMSDVYDRTTWQCNGLKSTGALVVDGNTRLTFLPCGEAQCVYPGYITAYKTGCYNEIIALQLGWNYNQGEPRFEKVTYWKYLAPYLNPAWGSSYGGYWNFGCYTWAWKIKTYKLPKGCNFRYQY